MRAKRPSAADKDVGRTAASAMDVDAAANGRQAESSVQQLMQQDQVHALLHKSGIEILRFIDGVAVLRGTFRHGGVTMAGSSANLYLQLEHPRDRGHLRVNVEPEESMDAHGGLIVHVIDKHTGKLALVGIAEGQEEHNPVTLAAARAALAAGVAPHPGHK
jgi:hypothetical protein